MANYADSNLLDAQIRLDARFGALELRFTDPTTFKAIMAGSGGAVPNYKAERAREDRAIDIKTFARTARTLGSARTFNHTGAKGDALTETLSWSTLSDTASISLKQADNNIYSFQEEFSNEIENMALNMVDGVGSAEDLAQDFLFDNRTAANLSSTRGTFDATDDVFQITESTDGDDIAQITQIVMTENKYKGKLTVFCDPVAWTKFEKLKNQGNANATNTSFAFGNITFVQSLGFGDASRFGGLNAAAGYPLGSWIAVPDAALAVLDWIPKQNRQTHTDSEGMFSFMEHPILGLEVAIHEYKERSDQSSLNSVNQDVLTQLEMSVDLSFFDSPISTTDTTAIVAFVLV